MRPSMWLKPTETCAKFTVATLLTIVGFVTVSVLPCPRRPCPPEPHVYSSPLSTGMRQTPLGVGAAHWRWLPCSTRRMRCT